MSWSWFRWHIVVKSSWQYIVFISYALFVEEASFYWQFRRGGTILFNSFFQNYAGCWLEFHFMFHALPGGLVVLIKFFIGVAQYAQIKKFSSCLVQNWANSIASAVFDHFVVQTHHSFYWFSVKCGVFWAARLSKIYTQLACALS